jgi:predicted GIY-YIG superfamily endonuclease
LRWRLTEHKEGASQATSYRGPWNLIYYKAYAEDADAMGRERYSKEWRRQKTFTIATSRSFRIVFEPREAKPFTRKK